MQDRLIKFWRSKRVLVTGHTGFKGSWLACILLKLNAKVIGYSLNPDKKSLFQKINLQDKIYKNYYKNINSYKELNKVIKRNKPQVIFHLASQPLVQYSYKNPVKTFIDNSIGTLNILEVVKNYNFIKSIVIITTDKVYKNDGRNIQFREDDDLWGQDPYSASKVCAEQIVSSYKSSFNHEGGLRFTSVARSGNVIGGCDHNISRIIPDIFDHIRRKKKLNVRMPDAIRPWQHVIEPTFGYISLAQKQYNNISLNKKNYKWNFGPEKSSFKKVSYIVNYIKKKIPFQYLTKKSNLKESKILMLNSTKAKKQLFWRPKLGIDKTLEMTIELEQTKKGEISKILNEQIKFYLK